MSEADASWSGVSRGPLQAGEWVRLLDAKGRKHNLCLTPGKQFHANRGSLDHDAMIGREEGFTITLTGGTEFLVFRPLLGEFVVSMPRGAAVVYPKDAAMIVAMADIYPGAHVVEAGVGSGALTCSLLRAVGPGGVVSSYERREEFADVARKNVTRFFSGDHPAWRLTVGDLAEELPHSTADRRADRVVLDMLAPWECVTAVADALVPGGLVCVYLATTTQLSRTVETLRAHGGFTEPHPFETMLREWHVEGLAVRPGHRGVGHTGFLLTARRMAPGQRPPVKRRRPAPGAYGADYSGPRPAGDVAAHQGVATQSAVPAEGPPTTSTGSPSGPPVEAPVEPPVPTPVGTPVGLPVSQTPARGDVEKTPADDPHGTSMTVPLSE